MSIINYEKMLKTTDIRVVKTRQALFNAIIQLASHDSFYSTTITELCKTAMINRKTFYVHYKSINDVLDDFQKYIVLGFIDIVLEREVLTSHSFNAYDYIILINDLVEENRKNFELLFTFLKNGTFLRVLGAELGKIAFSFMLERPGFFNTKSYPFSLVFTLCGLITSYFDWLDFGRQFPIEDLAAISRDSLSMPLNSILNSEQG